MRCRLDQILIMVLLMVLLFGTVVVAAPGNNTTAASQKRLYSCPYTIGGPTVSSRSSTIQLIKFGEIGFEQNCEQAEARGPGLLNLTGLGETTLVPGEMTSITVAFGSCTLAWPNRYGEIFLDFRGQGGFERLVDAVGGTRAGGMGNPFTFHFRGASQWTQRQARAGCE